MVDVITYGLPTDPIGRIKLQAQENASKREIEFKKYLSRVLLNDSSFEGSRDKYIVNENGMIELIVKK